MVEAPPRKIWPRHHRRSDRTVAAFPIAPPQQWSLPICNSPPNASTGQKPHDAFGVSPCQNHHDEQWVSATRPHCSAVAIVPRE
jgi:hypothetical protein